MYFLVEEFSNKSVLPPPLFFDEIYLLITESSKFLANLCKKKENKQEVSQIDNDDQKLIEYEKMCRSQYNDKKEQEKRANVTERFILFYYFIIFYYRHENYLLDIRQQTNKCLTQLAAIRNELKPK
jgi:hypothetical protein